MDQLKGQGFIGYKKVDLRLVTPGSSPRLVLCLPSVVKLQRFYGANEAEGGSTPGVKSWSMCSDEVGQTRAMTVSTELVFLHEINCLYTILARIVRSAPNVLCME